jgi:hypothetical protein
MSTCQIHLLKSLAAPTPCQHLLRLLQIKSQTTTTLKMTGTGSSFEAGIPPNLDSSSIPTASTTNITLEKSAQQTSLAGKSKVSGSKGGRAPWADETQESWLFKHLETFFEAQGASKVSDFLTTHWALWVSAFPETVKAGSCDLTKEFKTDKEAVGKMQTVSNHKWNAKYFNSQTFPEI